MDEEFFIITSKSSKIRLTLDYECELDPNKNYKLGLKYFSVYNSIRNVSEQNNQLKISKDDGKTFKLLTLLPGSYEYVSINEYIAQFVGSYRDRPNIEFEGNLNLNKIKLNLRPKHQVDFNVENSINELLGFEKKLYTKSTLAPYKANIENNIDIINIHCNLVDGGFFNKNKQQIIFSIPTFTVPIGYRIVEKPFQTTYLPINTRGIKDINLDIKDGHGRYLDFGEEEICIQLHVSSSSSISM